LKKWNSRIPVKKLSCIGLVNIINQKLVCLVLHPERNSALINPTRWPLIRRVIDSIAVFESHISLKPGLSKPHLG
jgi:hypothetical protein